MLTTCATALVLAAPAARAGTANAGLPGAGADPIAHMVWGSPGGYDNVGSAYQSASRSKKMLLGKLALEPRALWLRWENPTSPAARDGCGGGGFTKREPERAH